MIYGNIVWHIIKVAVPVSTLITCSNLGVENEECSKVTKHRIKLMLSCDVTYSCLLYIYLIFVMSSLILYSWRKSRLEAKNHMWYFVLNSIGLLICLPLIIDSLIIFIKHYDVYT